MKFEDIIKVRIRCIDYEVLHNAGTYTINGEQSMQVRWYCKVCRDWHYTHLTVNEIKKASGTECDANFIITLVLMITVLCVSFKVMA